MRILRGFLKNEEFGLPSSQAVRLEEQVIQIPVTTAAAEQDFEVPVNRFDHPQRYLSCGSSSRCPPPVIQQQPGEFLHQFQPLPAQLVDPALQVAS